MPSISVSSFLELNLSSLDDLENQWSTYVKKTVSHIDEIRSDISKRLDEDNFDGETAVGVRRQIKVVTNDFEDNVDSVGKKIKHAVADAIERFGANQEELRRRCDYAYNQGFAVADDGEVDAFPLHYTVTATPQILQGNNPYAHMSEEELIQRANDASDIEEKIKHTLGLFIAIDDELTQQLRSLDEGIEPAPMPLGASHSLDAEQAADDVMNLWDNAPLSEEDTAKILEIMDLYDGDSAFATSLLESLGGDGVMQMTAHITELGSRGNYTSESEEQALEFQNLMGNALALATNPGSGHSVDDEWIDGLMESATDGALFVDSPVKGVQLTGYHALAPLLEQGGYHDSLLVPLSEHMLALQTDDGWQSRLDNLNSNPFDLSGDLSPYPIDTMMGQLEQNPEAAAKVFSDSVIDSRSEYPGSGSSSITYDGWQEILNQDADSFDSRTFDTEQFGAALEAGATGVVPGTIETGDERPLSTERNAQIASDLVRYVSENPDQFTDPRSLNSAMMDNLASVTTHYIEDFQSSYHRDTEVGRDTVPDTHGFPLDFAESTGSTAPRAVQEWMRVLGHDVDAMAQVWTASEQVTYDHLATVAENGGNETQLGIIADTHAYLTADISSGALDFAVNASEEEIAKANKVVDDIEKGIDVGISFLPGDSRLPSHPEPVGGNLLGAMVSDILDVGRLSEEEREAIFERNENGAIDFIANLDSVGGNLNEMKDILRETTNMDERTIHEFVNSYQSSHENAIDPPSQYR